MLSKAVKAARAAARARVRLKAKAATQGPGAKDGTRQGPVPRQRCAKILACDFLCTKCGGFGHEAHIHLKKAYCAGCCPMCSVVWGGPY